MKKWLSMNENHSFLVDASSDISHNMMTTRMLYLNSIPFSAQYLFQYADWLLVEYMRKSTGYQP